MSREQMIRAAVVLILASGGLLCLNSFAPLQWPTVLAYSGLVTFAFGLLSVLIPPAWLGFSSRAHGMLVGIVTGAALFAAGLFWPTRTIATRAATSRIDAFMPVYDFHERHEITIHAPADRVRAELDRLSFADIGVMEALGRIRAAAMGRNAPGAPNGPAPSVPILEMIRKPGGGFFLLDDEPAEFVFGLAGEPWNNRGVSLTPEEFLRWSKPDCVKIAANFRIENVGGGYTRVVTETRVAANDEAARRKMTRYWALIYPGSGLIRRSLLRTIRDRAEKR